MERATGAAATKLAGAYPPQSKWCQADRTRAHLRARRPLVAATLQITRRFGRLTGPPARLLGCDLLLLMRSQARSKSKGEEPFPLVGPTLSGPLSGSLAPLARREAAAPRAGAEVSLVFLSPRANGHVWRPRDREDKD